MNKMYLDLWDDFLNSICDWCWMEWVIWQSDMDITVFQMVRVDNNRGNAYFGKKRKRLMKDRLRKEFKLEMGI